MANEVSWTCSLGNTYRFSAYQKTTTWNKVGGVYAFATESPPGNWQVFYIGQTDDFSQRMPNHDRWEEAVRSGARIVLACPIPNAATRDQVERELCQQLKPNLNTHHVGLLGR